MIKKYIRILDFKDDPDYEFLIECLNNSKTQYSNQQQNYCRTLNTSIENRRISLSPVIKKKDIRNPE